MSSKGATKGVEGGQKPKGSKNEKSDIHSVPRMGEEPQDRIPSSPTRPACGGRRSTEEETHKIIVGRRALYKRGKKQKGQTGTGRGRKPKNE